MIDHPADPSRSDLSRLLVEISRLADALSPHGLTFS